MLIVDRGFGKFTGNKEIFSYGQAYYKPVLGTKSFQVNSPSLNLANI